MRLKSILTEGFFTWKVNVICWVSAERTWRRRNGKRKKENLHILLLIILTALQPTEGARKMSVAGNYSRRRSAWVAFLSSGLFSLKSNKNLNRMIPPGCRENEVLRGITVVERACASVSGLFVVGPPGNQAFHPSYEHPTTLHRLRTN